MRGIRKIPVSAPVSACGKGGRQKKPRAPFAPPPARVYQPAMRLKSEIFVSALIRRVFSLGGYAAVLRRGAEEAGAIFIRQRSRFGTETLYAPAPQSVFDDPQPGRLFEVRLDGVDGAAVDAAVDREIRFDPDCCCLLYTSPSPRD